MTDLISKLADDIVALNNASPRLPRKEQIEEVLRAALDPFTLDGSTFIGGQTVLLTGHNDISHSHSITFTGAPTYTGSSYLATQEQLVQAADEICQFCPEKFQRMVDELAWDARAFKDVPEYRDLCFTVSADTEARCAVLTVQYKRSLIKDQKGPLQSSARVHWFEWECWDALERFRTVNARWNEEARDMLESIERFSRLAKS